MRKLSERSRLVGVGQVEVRYKLLGVPKFSGKDPGHLLVGAFITGPADQVQESAGPMPLVNLRVEDFRDSSSLLTSMGGGGVWRCLEMEFGVAGSN